MKRNPLVPFAVIAIIAVLAMVILSFQGHNKGAELANGENQMKNAVADAKPEEIVKQTCISCHGENLEGAVGPDLTKIGSRYSAKEIQDILLNGKNGGMPAGLVPADQAEDIAKWLAETYK